ncbi:hypothetical protein AMTRI_Chr10g7210 [Amborella trichopoda]
MAFLIKYAASNSGRLIKCTQISLLYSTLGASDEKGNIYQRISKDVGEDRYSRSAKEENSPPISLGDRLTQLPDLPFEKPFPKSKEDRENLYPRISKEENYPSISLGERLAFLPDFQVDKPSQTRVELKRSLETRIKKRVKEQYLNGKFHNLVTNVIATSKTLEDAYNSIRHSSNSQANNEHDGLCFISMAKELLRGDFDVEANTVKISPKSLRERNLILPNLKLKVIQEAIRIVVEVVYRPHFSKICHGCRSGRGTQSALRYICNEIENPNWYFAFCVTKEVDTHVFNRLISIMEERIEDASFYALLRLMFEAQVLNLEFGGFPKGQGLPQEGTLSPILMNVNLSLFDAEFYRLCMRYEGLSPNNDDPIQAGRNSKLRNWFRRQIKGEDSHNRQAHRLHACRYMDEILVAVSGPEDLALEIRESVYGYLRESLSLEVVEQGESPLIKPTSGVRFLGMFIRASDREEISSAVRVVHKLKDKMQLFASQKEVYWEAMTARIGKKFVGRCLKNIKEEKLEREENMSMVLMNRISEFRRPGMEPEHWFRHLLKIWIQDLGTQVKRNEEETLAKHIVEPELPLELVNSFYNFQQKAKEYISSESLSTRSLLESHSLSSPTMTTKLEAPIRVLKKSMIRYGLIDTEGNPRHISMLILQDDLQIINWFCGLVRRWKYWFRECDNFETVRLMILECVRKSCVRTLSTKHHVSEAVIERRYESELSNIPLRGQMEFFSLSKDKEKMTNGRDSLSFSSEDEMMLYGSAYAGLFVLSLAQVKRPSALRVCRVMCCSVPASSIYSVHVFEKRKHPGWKTGFSSWIPPALNRKRIPLCKQHVKDLYMGDISLQVVDFSPS